MPIGLEDAPANADDHRRLISDGTNAGSAGQRTESGAAGPEIDLQMSSHLRQTQPFVWSGIALTIPAGWETGALGRGYALLEHRFRPVLELKTALIRGRFSPQRHLKRLARSGQQGGRPSLEPISPPPEWPAFPPTVLVSAFAWQGARVGGKGLVHFCQTCRRATLIQFFDHGDRGVSEIPPVLKSFRDHGRESGPSFAVYDIQATLPETYALQQFRFEAGRFTLVFGQARKTVTLWRWSPANIVLAECGGRLEGLVKKDGLLPPKAAIDDGPPAAENGMQWHWRGSRFYGGLRRLFRPHAPEAHNALRVWHSPRDNRILAVRAEALPDRATFDRICHSYGIIPKESTAPVAG